MISYLMFSFFLIFFYLLTIYFFNSELSKNKLIRYSQIIIFILFFLGIIYLVIFLLKLLLNSTLYWNQEDFIWKLHLNGCTIYINQNDYIIGIENNYSVMKKLWIPKINIILAILIGCWTGICWQFISLLEIPFFQKVELVIGSGFIGFIIYILFM